MWCLVTVCFFKQKTAYEMRISDWSSDVCSSDLTVTYWAARSAWDGAPIPTLGSSSAPPTMISPTCRDGHQVLATCSTPRRNATPMRCGDRQSVGSGTSVSVRVDLGGRGIITKKIPIVIDTPHQYIDTSIN